MKKTLFTLLLSIPVLASGQEKGWSLGLTASPDYSYRAIKSKDASLNWIKESLDKTEKAKFGFTAGLAARYRFNKRWTFQTGLEYSQVKWGTNKAVLLTEGDFDPITGTPTEGSGAKLERSESYSYLAIPLKTDFTILGTKKLSLFASAGFTTNYFMFASYSAAIIHPDGSVTASKVSGRSNEINALTLSINASAGVRYVLNKKLSLEAAPVYRRFLTPLNNTGSVKHYPYSAGLNIGVFYRL